MQSINLRVGNCLRYDDYLLVLPVEDMIDCVLYLRQHLPYPAMLSLFEADEVSNRLN